MWSHKFTLELIFDNEQLTTLYRSYMRQINEGFDGTLEDFIETLAQVGVCTTLLEMAKNL